MKERRKIKILPFLMALIICVCSYRVPVQASEASGVEFVVWTEQTRELYDNSYGSQMFCVNNDEAALLYDGIKEYVDFSLYDDVIIYSACDGSTTSSSNIYIYGFIGEHDARAYFSSQYYSNADTISTQGFLYLMIDMTQHTEIYKTQLDWTVGTGITNCDISHQLVTTFQNNWGETGDYGIYAISHGATKMTHLSNIIYSTIPLYSGYEYNQAVGITATNHCYNKPDIADYCVDYSQKAYAYSEDGISEWTPSTSAKYEANNELCFDTFLVEKINHPDMLGGSGARVQYSYGDKLFEAIQNDNDYTMKMHYDVEITYSVTCWSDGKLVQDITGNPNYKDIIYFDIEEDIEFRTKQDGVYLFDVNSIVGDKLANEDGYFYMILNGYSASDTNFAGKLALEYLGLDDSTLVEFFGEGTTDISLDYLDIAVTGRVYDYSDSTIMSNSGWGHAELVSGQNSSYVNTYNPETGESEKGATTSGNNYYNVVTETDSGGNTYYNYYYYDTTNNTVTPSVGTVANTLMLTFANPLQLQGVNIDNSSNSSSSGGGSSGYDIPELIIEDDDYTDVALREDLKDGFGLFDNSETDIKADGYLNLAAAFFNNIDPELQGILTFGISSVVVIGILRSVFRR